MLKLFFFTLFFYNSYFFAQNDVKVKSYRRNDGQLIDAHWRSNPDNTSKNNWSTIGNVNPYTGKKGDKSVNDNNIINTNFSYYNFNSPPKELQLEKKIRERRDELLSPINPYKIYYNTEMLLFEMLKSKEFYKAIHKDKYEIIIKNLYKELDSMKKQLKYLSIDK
jgi:hypothetical protein